MFKITVTAKLSDNTYIIDERGYNDYSTVIIERNKTIDKWLKVICPHIQINDFMQMFIQFNMPDLKMREDTIFYYKFLLIQQTINLLTSFKNSFNHVIVYEHFDLKIDEVI
jgi:hypothetical protein